MKVAIFTEDTDVKLPPIPKTRQLESIKHTQAPPTDPRGRRNWQDYYHNCKDHLHG